MLEILRRPYFYTMAVTFYIVLKHGPICFAQENAGNYLPGYHIRYYTDENGLPQNSVKSIARDARGNIWLATERGVVRYDGHHFVTFDKFGDSFADRNVRGFYLNPAPGGEQILALNHNYVPIRIVDGKAYLDSADTKMLGGRSVSHNPEKHEFLAEMLPELNEKPFDALVSNQVNTVFPFPGNKYFVYNEQKVIYYINNKEKKIFSFPDRNLFQFFRLGEELYYLDDKLDVFCFRVNTVASLPVRIKLGGAITHDPLFASGHPYELFWNNSVGQAFIILEKSIYLLEHDENGTLTSTLILDGFDLKTNVIKCFYYDDITNRVFLGSPFNGLFVVEKKMFRAVTGKVPVPDYVYYGQTMFDKNTILTADGTLFDVKQAQNKINKDPVSIKAQVPGLDPFGILKDSRGDIWSKQGDKLFRIDGTGNRILSTSRFPGGITLIYEGEHSRIWIGTAQQGLYYIDKREPKPAPRKFIGKSLRNISWVHQQSDRLLWVGSGDGLFRLDLLTKKMAHVKGLEKTYVRSLYIPANRPEIWITTYTKGFYLLKDGKLTRFPLDRQQYLASAHCIFEDKRGFFWITTNKGLFQIKRTDLIAYVSNPSELYYHYYSKTAGFNTNEFNGGCEPCAVHAPNGIVSFPSIKGLVWFEPEKIMPELPGQELYIEDLTVDNVGVKLRGNMLALTTSGSEIALKVNTPYFGDDYNMRISYRIVKDGETLTDWKVVNNENMTISTPPLESGSYTLSLRKLRGFGVGNYDYKHLHIEVKKQWYETWWFKGTLLAIVLLIFYFILKQRVKKISKLNLILEAKVNERTQHLEETLRVLNASGIELERRDRTQLRLIASVTHDVRNPVRHMGMAMRFVRDLIEKNQVEAAVSAVKKIEENSDRIYQLIDNMISFIKPEVYRTNSDFKYTALSWLVTEKIQIFKDMDGAVIHINIGSSEFVNTDPTLLGVVIHNLLDNAIKAKRENKIEISTERRGKDLYLVFSDQGPGMPVELINWLNRGLSDENPDLPASYEGLGLLMVKEITKILRINMHAENVPGARISLKFSIDAGS